MKKHFVGDDFLAFVRNKCGQVFILATAVVSLFNNLPMFE